MLSNRSQSLLESIISNTRSSTKVSKSYHLDFCACFDGVSKADVSGVLFQVIGRTPFSYVEDHMLPSQRILTLLFNFGTLVALWMPTPSRLILRTVRKTRWGIPLEIKEPPIFLLWSRSLTVKRTRYSRTRNFKKRKGKRLIEAMIVSRFVRQITLQCKNDFRTSMFLHFPPLPSLPLFDLEYLPLLD